MPIINLIQEQRIADQKRDQGVRIALFALSGTFALGFLGYGILMFQRQALLAEQSRLQSEIAANEPVMAQIDACVKTEDSLKPRVTTLEEAQKVSNKWEDILTRLQTQTPIDTWLTGLQCPQVPDDQPISLVFSGTGRSQEPISEFILRAQNQPYLDSVQLHFTQEKRAASGGKAIDFEMGAQISGSAEKKESLDQEQKS
jgi:Tfp pilus assembly protein PilN